MHKTIHKKSKKSPDNTAVREGTKGIAYAAPAQFKNISGEETPVMQNSDAVSKPFQANAGYTGEQQILQRRPVVQRVISSVVTLNVNGVKQTKSKRCWAAVGWSIDSFYGGTYLTLDSFVKNNVSSYGKGRHTRNGVCDIDHAIGSRCNGVNRLSGSDSAPPFFIAAINMELTGNKPIVANLGGVHYVIICGSRDNNGVYELQIMDPLTGGFDWRATGGPGGQISTVGGVALSVIYFT